MNPEFVRLQEMMDEVRLLGSTLTDEQRREIESTCESHAQQHTNGKIGTYNVCAVHPYFLQLEGNKFYAKVMGIRLDDKPTKTLEGILRNVNRERFTTALFEDYPSYAYRTHELVEEGLVDTVIFTEWQRGVPVHGDALKGFSISKQNYVGGAIAHQCVQQAINSIRQHAPYFSIRPIRDAISHHEPELWQKALTWIMWPWIVQGMYEGNIEAATNNNKFRFLSRTYTLLNGVNSYDLLK